MIPTASDIARPIKRIVLLVVLAIFCAQKDVRVKVMNVKIANPLTKTKFKSAIMAAKEARSNAWTTVLCMTMTVN